jgi:hypothetical protein
MIGYNFLGIRADRVAQAIQHLPSKHEALSSNPNTAKKKKVLN